MNILKRLSIGMAVLAAGLATIQAQTPNPVPPVAPADNTEAKTSVITFVQNVESARTISLAVYPSYAPDIVVNGKKDTFGVGIAALCPASAISALSSNAIAQHAFGGLRLDYLAHQAFASTVAVGMKGDVQLWGHNFEFFGHSGANIPFSGFGVKNGDIGAMVGGGGYTSLFSFANGNGNLGLQVSAEKWTQFPGMVFHGGPVLTWSW